jgi:starch synthase
VLLRTQHAEDPAVRSLPVVFTIHNLGYQGLFPQAALRSDRTAGKFVRDDALEFYGEVNFLKGGLLFADYLTTVSRRYAKEIQTPEYGSGLEGVIAAARGPLVGILNGVDYSDLEPRIRHENRAELFGARSGRQKSLQEGFA